MVRATVPAIGGAFQGAAHGVVPQIAISTRPNRTITVLIAADSTNKNSDLLISYPPRRYAVGTTYAGSSKILLTAIGIIPGLCVELL